MNHFTVTIMMSLVGVAVGSKTQKLRDCMCVDCVGVDQSDRCKKYGEELGNELWPAILLFLFMLGLWFFACARRCCHCCGDVLPSGNCCCRDKKEMFMGYSGCEKIIYRSLMLTVAVSAMVIGIPALTTNDLATDGVQGLGNELDVIYNDIVGAIDIVVAESLPLPDITDSVKVDIQLNADDAKKEMKILRDIRLDILKYDHEEVYSRRKITIGFFCLIMGTFVFFLLVPLFGCGVTCATTALFALFLFTSLFVFIFVLVHHSLAVFTTDFCSDYGYLAQQTLEEVEKKIGCGGGTGGISRLLTDIEEAKTTYSQRVCNDLFLPVCNPALPVGFNCPTAPCLPGANIHDFSLMLTDSTSKTTGVPFQNCPNGVCSISQCAVHCENVGGIQDASRWAYNNFTIYGGALSRVEEELYPIAACAPLRTFVENIHYPLCSQLKPAINDIFRIAVSQFGLLVVASWLLLMGDKRLGSRGTKTQIRHLEAKGGNAVSTHDVNTNNAGVA